MSRRGTQRRSGRSIAVALAMVCALTGLSWLGAPAANACGRYPGPCPGDTTPAPTGTPTTSSPTQTATYNTPTQSCSVYANGTGMGSYCTTLGGGTTQSLRQRFPGQVFDRCRYSDPPASLPVPFNARPDEGRYMLMQCIDNVDFDTFSGGAQRQLTIQIVWVPNGTDTTIHHNGITDFLWQSVESGAQMPVPFLRTRPNQTPVVGYPTFFTFRWLDPVTHHVVAEGPYAGKADGGPFKQIESQGLIIRASGVRIHVDPMQVGIPGKDCPANPQYTEGAPTTRQPNSCSIDFPRSSASARTYAKDEIPSYVRDAFYAAVTVEWRVTYGDNAADLNQLGNGFTMRVRQVLPVQEVQVPDQPPTAIY